MGAAGREKEARREGQRAIKVGRKEAQHGKDGNREDERYTESKRENLNNSLQSDADGNTLVTQVVARDYQGSLMLHLN